MEPWCLGAAVWAPAAAWLVLVAALRTCRVMAISRACSGIGVLPAQLSLRLLWRQALVWQRVEAATALFC